MINYKRCRDQWPGLKNCGAIIYSILCVWDLGMIYVPCSIMKSFSYMLSMVQHLDDFILCCSILESSQSIELFWYANVARSIFFPIQASFGVFWMVLKTHFLLKAIIFPYSMKQQYHHLNKWIMAKWNMLVYTRVFCIHVCLNTCTCIKIPHIAWTSAYWVVHIGLQQIEVWITQNQAVCKWGRLVLSYPPLVPLQRSFELCKKWKILLSFYPSFRS